MTIEFILWIPVITALLVIVVDATTLYLANTEMSVVARDTARRMTTGQITSKQEAEAFAVSAMANRVGPARAQAVYDPSGAMEVTLFVDYADISVIGYSALTIVGGTLENHVEMKSPPVLAAMAGTLGAPGGGVYTEPPIVVASTGNGSGNGNGNGNSVGTTGSLLNSSSGNGNGNGKKL